MMSVRRRSSGPILGLSASSWPAWLMAPTGLRISWAMLADSRPNCGDLALLNALSHEAGVFQEYQRGSGRGRLQLSKCGWITRAPSATTKLEAEFSTRALCRHVAREYRRRGDTSPSSAPGTAMAAAENLGCGFVDEADLIGGVDHQQALAQVLHDVLGQLGEVRQIDVLLTNQVLALRACGRANEGRRGYDAEQYGPEKAGGCKGNDVGMTAQLLPNGVDQHCNGGNCRQEQGTSRRQQEGETADGKQQQQAEAAGDSAAGMQQQQQQR